MAPCMSATIACKLFLQTSGNAPSSLTIPPLWPPIPSAQVLQAFFERIARHSFQMPPASRAFRQVYHTAGHPPPDRTCFMAQLFDPSRPNSTPMRPLCPQMTPIYADQQCNTPDGQGVD